MHSLRPLLRWLLLVTVVAVAAALWWPDAVTPALVRAGIEMQPQTLALVVPAAPAVAAVRVALPNRLPKPSLDIAKFDPFLGVIAAPTPPPQQARAPQAALPPPIAAPLPTRIAPPLNYRYLGQMVDPTGRKLIYLARGDAAVQVAVGGKLEEGYVVEAMDADGIRLLYAPMDVRTVIPVPPSREPATR